MLEKQLENVRLAQRLWADVKPENVVPRLDMWRCGTVACFGGHLATWPEFQTMGVQPWPPNGEPVMFGGSCFGGSVALELFGDRRLFATIQPHEEDMPEHEAVTIRLQAQQALLERALGL